MTGSFEGISDGPAISVRPHETLTLSFVVAGGDEFIGTVAVQVTDNLSYWKLASSAAGEPLRYTGTVSAPLTGTVVSGSVVNETKAGQWYRVVCSAFDNASDPLDWTLSEAANDIIGTLLLYEGVPILQVRDDGKLVAPAGFAGDSLDPEWSASPALTSATFSGAGTTLSVAPAANYLLTHDPNDPNTRLFRFGYGIFDVNGADPRNNVVWSFGYNLANGGGRADAAEHTVGLVMESYYVSGGVAGAELHLTSTDTAGVEHRVFTAFMPVGGGVGSSIGVGGDVVTLRTYAGTPKVQFNLLIGSVSVLASTQVLFEVNNAVVATQRNAADSAYINLPYVNADNRLVMVQPVFSGPAITTGDYPNVFAPFNCTSIPAEGSVVKVLCPSVTGNYYGLEVVGAATEKFIFALYNNTNNASACAVIDLRTIGTAAGDPMILFNVNGGTTWYVGLHNSDSDKFKWSASDTFGNADRMILTTDGNLSITGTFTLAEAKDVIVGTATGTKFGTATSQKISFYNATPIVQGASVADATDAASAITQLNALISRIEATGLIATV